MKNTIKFISLLLVIVIVAAMAFGCGEETTNPSKDTNASNNDTTSSKNNDKEPTSDALYTIEAANVYAGSDWLSVVIPVKNTGSKPIYLNTGSITVCNSKGTKVTEITLANRFPVVVKPGETGYYFGSDTKLELTENDTYTATVESTLGKADARFKLIDEAKIEQAYLTVSNISSEYYTGALHSYMKFNGTIKNSTSQAYQTKYANVAVLIYDKNDKVIDIACGQLNIYSSEKAPDSFAPEAEIAFKGIHGADIPEADISKTEAFGYINHTANS